VVRGRTTFERLSRIRSPKDSMRTETGAVEGEVMVIFLVLEVLGKVSVSHDIGYLVNTDKKLSAVSKVTGFARIKSYASHSGNTRVAGTYK